MHIITKKRLKEFWQAQPAAESALRAWAKIAQRAVWKNLAETRRDCPSADMVCDCTVFNVGGNKYRLIAYLNYRAQRLYVLHVLTHREYDKGK